MYCRKCGTELNDDATFCTMCGNTMVKNESSDNRDMHGTKKGKRKTIVIAIAAVALIMLVAAVGIFVFMSGKSDKPVVEFDVKPDDKMKRTDDANADTIECVINTQLQNLCSDDEITSYANPKTYKTVDEILNNYNENDSYNNYVFENNVFKNIPERYYIWDAADNYSVVTKQSGYTMYVLITGTLEDGYVAEVECAKTDPFIDER